MSTPEQQTEGHPHAELALQYWAEAATNKEAWRNWQNGTGDSPWRDCLDVPLFHPQNKYRRRPAPTHYMVEGVEIPMPETDKLERGAGFLCVNYDDPRAPHYFEWSGGRSDKELLTEGLVYLDRTLAIEAGQKLADIRKAAIAKALNPSAP